MITKLLDLSAKRAFLRFYLPVSILVLGLSIRALYAFRVEPFLHWDEAPQALMARWIGEGEIYPVVLFQLPYIGAVEQYPLALFMLLIGDNVFTLNAFYFFLSAVSLIFSFYFYRRVLGDLWANFAFALFAFSFPLVLLFSLQSYSFGGLILLESVVLWFLVLSFPRKRSLVVLGFLGFINGVALYNNILSIGFLFFSMWLAFSSGSWRGFSFCLLGFLIGYSPMLYFNVTNDFISYQILAAKFLGVTREMVENQGTVHAVLNGFLNDVSGRSAESDLAILFSFPGFFSDQGYLLQIAAFAILVGLVVLALFLLNPRIHNSLASWSLCPYSIRLAFVACTILTGVFAISQARYMTAIMVPIPVLVCEGLMVCQKYSKKVMIVLASFLIFYLLIGHFMVLSEDYKTHKDKCAQVFGILEQNHLTHGYGSYQFQAYSAFLSNSRIKISTQIGPVYLDKIPSFSQAVDKSDDVFYILPADSSYLDYIHSNSISFQIEKLRDWWIIWDLSERIYPEDLLPEKELSRSDGYRRWSYRENPSVLNVYRGGH